MATNGKKEWTKKAILGLIALVFLLHALFLLNFLNPFSSLLGSVLGLSPQESLWEQTLLSMQTAVLGVIFLVLATIVFACWLWQMLFSTTKNQKNIVWIGNLVGIAIDFIGKYFGRMLAYIIAMIFFDIAIASSFNPNPTMFPLADFNHVTYLFGFLVASDWAFNWSASIIKKFGEHASS